MTRLDHILELSEKVGLPRTLVHPSEHLKNIVHLAATSDACSVCQVSNTSQMALNQYIGILEHLGGTEDP